MICPAEQVLGPVDPQIFRSLEKGLIALRIKSNRDAIRDVQCETKAIEAGAEIRTRCRYVDLEPIQFTYALLTRSQRVSHENLRLRDQRWLERVEEWFAGKATGGRIHRSVPPMFVRE